jgi:hypothetical protein
MGKTEANIRWVATRMTIIAPTAITIPKAMEEPKPNWVLRLVRRNILST